MTAPPARRQTGGGGSILQALAASPAMASLSIMGGLLLYNVMGAIEPSIVAILYRYGDAHQVMGRNPVTFCNILFISNLTAGVTLMVMFRRQITWSNLRSMTRRQWIMVLYIAIPGDILGPMMYFLALAHAEITNVVLISSLQIPLGALLAFMVFGERLGRLNILGHGLIVAGIALPFVFFAGGIGASFGFGELLAAGSMLTRVFLLFSAKEAAVSIPPGIIGVVGATVGTIFFFATATITYGPSHFQDLMTPNLWMLVLLYAVVLVGARYVVNIKSFRRASRQNIMAMETTYPVLAMVAAVLIAGQIPGVLQIVSGVILTAGALLAINWSQRGQGGIAQNTAGDRLSVRCNPNPPLQERTGL